MHPHRASTLVTTGANAVSRNPMYVGLVGVLVANAVRRGSWKALLPAVAFTLVVDRLQVATEESAMLATFGADYEAYRAAVPRWLGPASITAARGPAPFFSVLTESGSVRRRRPRRPRSSRPRGRRGGTRGPGRESAR